MRKQSPGAASRESLFLTHSRKWRPEKKRLHGAPQAVWPFQPSSNIAQKLYPTPFPSPEPQSANQKPKQCKLYFTNYHWCDLRPPSWTQVKPFLESKHNTPGISAHPRLCGAQLGDLLLQPHRSLSCWPSQPERITLVHYLCCWFTKYWCYCFACVGFPIAAA